MSREVDTRDFTENRAEPARRAELEERAAAVSAGLPGAERVVIAEVDPVTGSASRLLSVDATELDAASAEASDYVQRALDHLAVVQPALGLADDPRRQFVAAPPLTTSSGAHAVHLTQEYAGIGIFQTAQVVRFAPDGTIVDTAGTVVGSLPDTSSDPAISAQEAVLRAAEHVATPHEDELGQVDPFGEPLSYPTVDLTGWQPEIVEGPSPDPREVTLLAPGPFGAPIRCERTWFPQDADTLRLGYDIWIMLPEASGQYDVVVDAVDGRVLYAHQMMRFALGRRQRVPHRPPDRPGDRRVPVPDGELPPSGPGPTRVAGWLPRGLGGRRPDGRRTAPTPSRWLPASPRFRA